MEKCKLQNLSLFLSSIVLHIFDFCTFFNQLCLLFISHITCTVCYLLSSGIFMSSVLMCICFRYIYVTCTVCVCTFIRSIMSPVLSVYVLSSGVLRHMYYLCMYFYQVYLCHLYCLCMYFHQVYYVTCTVFVCTFIRCITSHILSVHVLLSGIYMSSVLSVHVLS